MKLPLLAALALAPCAEALADPATNLAAFTLYNVSETVNGAAVPAPFRIDFDAPELTTLTFTGVREATWLEQTSGQHRNGSFGLDFDIRLKEGFANIVVLHLYDMPVGRLSGGDATNAIVLSMRGTPPYPDSSEVVERLYNINPSDFQIFSTHIVFRTDADRHVHVHLDALLYTDFDAPGSGAAVGLGDPEFAFQLSPVPEQPMWALLVAGLPLLARRRQVSVSPAR